MTTRNFCGIKVRPIRTHFCRKKIRPNFFQGRLNRTPVNTRVTITSTQWPVYVTESHSLLVALCCLVALNIGVCVFGVYDDDKYGRVMKVFCVCCGGLLFGFSPLLSNLSFDCWFSGGRGYVFLLVLFLRISCESGTWGCTVVCSLPGCDTTLPIHQ